MKWILLISVPVVLCAQSTSSAKSRYSQSLPLHPGWNLVSWHIEPLEPDIYMWQILPPENAPPPYEYADWFFENGGQLYKWDDNVQFYPQWYQSEVWILDYAYYMLLDEPYTWGYADKPRFALGPVEDIEPSDAWAHDQNVGSPYAGYWFFMGYAAPGYSKLASIPNTEQAISGDPDLFDYEGPFHWLIWQDDEQNNYPRYDLRVVKDDQGKVYLPIPNPTGAWRPHIDQIGVLEPGRGYFLGFIGEGPYTFEGWGDWPQWRDESSMGPAPKTGQPEIASAAHFQYNPCTHWSYPIVIDTVDQAQCPMEAGDELGVFDGDRCVGAVIYQGEFPAVLVAWEDDIATPLDLDGYLFGSPMTFKWYDVSANAEIEFQLPPEIQALQDDPVAPDHSGFGWGLYGRRSFSEGVVAAVNQLPQVYGLGQNYPNPFNAETIIPLELPQRSRVRLEIFNVQGRLLGKPYETIVDAGWPKIRWNASKLPSGVYFYRITAEGLERGGKFTDAGKMLVLK